MRAKFVSKIRFCPYIFHITIEPKKVKENIFNAKELDLTFTIYYWRNLLNIQASPNESTLRDKIISETQIKINHFTKISINSKFIHNLHFQKSFRSILNSLFHRKKKDNIISFTKAKKID
jgi:hypothetical protein